MKLLAALLLLGLPLAAFSQVPQQQVEIQRALIQRDQQSAEFSRRGLENLHSNQLRDAGRQVNPELLPYERQSMERERELVRSNEEKKPASPDYKPLPLPGSGGPPHVVEPISTPSIGG
jgi:uncharacterized protein HemX